MTQSFTVTELNERIKDRLENDLRMHDLWVQGELSNFVYHWSGHRYFTLKDQNSQISCVLFRNQGFLLDFEPKNGQNVVVYGDVSVYRPQGRIQLVAKGLKKDNGLGFRYAELEAIKKKLATEGLFSSEHKRNLPKYPERIGIVTSPQGAAIRDVLRIIGQYPARIIISPARVQGDGAESSICAAIHALKGLVDVVILCRGGGSAEDLWCFNSEKIARAIYDCDSPVISAIGHEIDFTIADFVADVRAATPTAAAKMAVPDLDELKMNLLKTRVKLIRSLWTLLERKKEHLNYLSGSLTPRYMYTITAEGRQKLDYLFERLLSTQKEIMNLNRCRLELSESRLAAVGPKSTLKRGYSIIKSVDGLVLHADEVAVGETLELILHDGKLVVRVLDTHTEEVFH